MKKIYLLTKITLVFYYLHLNTALSQNACEISFNKKATEQNKSGSPFTEEDSISYKLYNKNILNIPISDEEATNSTIEYILRMRVQDLSFENDNNIDSNGETIISRQSIEKIPESQDNIQIHNNKKITIDIDTINNYDPKISNLIRPMISLSEKSETANTTRLFMTKTTESIIEEAANTNLTDFVLDSIFDGSDALIFEHLTSSFTLINKAAMGILFETTTPTAIENKAKFASIMAGFSEIQNISTIKKMIEQEKFYKHGYYRNLSPSEVELKETIDIIRPIITNRIIDTIDDNISILKPRKDTLPLTTISTYANAIVDQLKGPSSKFIGHIAEIFNGGNEQHLGHEKIKSKIISATRSKDMTLAPYYNLSDEGNYIESLDKLYDDIIDSHVNAYFTKLEAEIAQSHIDYSQKIASAYEIYRTLLITSKLILDVYLKSKFSDIEAFAQAQCIEDTMNQLIKLDNKKYSDRNPVITKLRACRGGFELDSNNEIIIKNRLALPTNAYMDKLYGAKGIQTWSEEYATLLTAYYKLRQNAFTNLRNNLETIHARKTYEFRLRANLNEEIINDSSSITLYNLNNLSNSDDTDNNQENFYKKTILGELVDQAYENYDLALKEILYERYANYMGSTNYFHVMGKTGKPLSIIKTSCFFPFKNPSPFPFYMSQNSYLTALSQNYIDISSLQNYINEISADELKDKPYYINTYYDPNDCIGNISYVRDYESFIKESEFFWTLHPGSRLLTSAMKKYLDNNMYDSSYEKEEDIVNTYDALLPYIMLNLTSKLNSHDYNIEGFNSWFQQNGYSNEYFNAKPYMAGIMLRQFSTKALSSSSTAFSIRKRDYVYNYDPEYGYKQFYLKVGEFSSDITDRPLKFSESNYSSTDKDIIASGKEWGDWIFLPTYSYSVNNSIYSKSRYISYLPSRDMRIQVSYNTRADKYYNQYKKNELSKSEIKEDLIEKINQEITKRAKSAKFKYYNGNVNLNPSIGSYITNLYNGVANYNTSIVSYVNSYIKDELYEQNYIEKNYINPNYSNIDSVNTAIRYDNYWKHANRDVLISLGNNILSKSIYHGSAYDMNTSTSTDLPLITDEDIHPYYNYKLYNSEANTNIYTTNNISTSEKILIFLRKIINTKWESDEYNDARKIIEDHYPYKVENENILLEGLLKTIENSSKYNGITNHELSLKRKALHFYVRLIAENFSIYVYNCELSDKRKILIKQFQIPPTLLNESGIHEACSIKLAWKTREITRDDATKLDLNAVTIEEGSSSQLQYFSSKTTDEDIFPEELFSFYTNTTNNSNIRVVLPISYPEELPFRIDFIELGTIFFSDIINAQKTGHFKHGIKSNINSDSTMIPLYEGYPGVGNVDSIIADNYGGSFIKDNEYTRKFLNIVRSIIHETQLYQKSYNTMNWFKNDDVYLSNFGEKEFPEDLFNNSYTSSDKIAEAKSRLATRSKVETEALANFTQELQESIEVFSNRVSNRTSQLNSLAVTIDYKDLLFNARYRGFLSLMGELFSVNKDNFDPTATPPVIHDDNKEPILQKRFNNHKNTYMTASRQNAVDTIAVNYYNYGLLKKSREFITASKEKRDKILTKHNKRVQIVSSAAKDFFDYILNNILNSYQLETTTRLFYTSVKQCYERIEARKSFTDDTAETLCPKKCKRFGYKWESKEWETITYNDDYYTYSCYCETKELCFK